MPISTFYDKGFDWTHQLYLNSLFCSQLECFGITTNYRPGHPKWDTQRNNRVPFRVPSRSVQGFQFESWIPSGSSLVASLGFGFEFFGFKTIGSKLVEFSSLRVWEKILTTIWPKCIALWHVTIFYSRELDLIGVSIFGLFLVWILAIFRDLVFFQVWVWKNTYNSWSFQVWVNSIKL